MHTILQDFRFALRQLRKSPGFALTTILTLALGIGATTAIFSLVNTVLLRPLPLPEQERLMSLHEVNPAQGGRKNQVLSYPDFFDWRAQNHTFSGMASYHGNQFTLIGTGDPRHLEGQVVSADFFRVLGVDAKMGRGFNADEEKPGVHVAVLSHELWQSVFGGAAEIVGKAIDLDGHSYLVTGVMPAGFTYPLRQPKPLLWTTLADDAYDPSGDPPSTQQRGAHWLDVIGRLKPEVTQAQASADLSLIASNLAAAYPDSNKKVTQASVIPELEHLIGKTRPALRLLFASVLFVLLIACANVAGLLLARSSRRRPELALRTALGATRAQIMRQILVESVSLSLCGGAAGLALAFLSLKLITAFAPKDVPRLDQLSIDGMVFLFAIAISIATGLLFGVLPAWRMSRLDPSQSLREGGRSVTAERGQHRLHNSLVIAETAIGLVLLVGSGLLIRSFIRVLHVDPGFDAKNVLIASLDLPTSRYPGTKPVEFYDQLLPRIAALPGVESVAAGWPLPLSGNMMGISIEIEGRPTAKGDSPSEMVAVATPGFFHTMHIPVLRGREFTEQDKVGANAVVMVTDSFARKYFPNEDALGKRFKPGLSDGVTKETMREIVGVVGDVKERDLTTDFTPQYYLPFAQAIVSSPTLIVRGKGDTSALMGPVREQVAEMDKNVPLYDVRTLEDSLSAAAAQPRFQTMLLAFFAGIALLLSAVGLYAVLSYMVVQRTLEIGVRMALGARRGDVLRLILRRGLTLAATGLAVGIIASLLLTRLIAGLLYQVRPLDPITFSAVILVLLAVSVLASSAPAYRAARMDPMRTLREQ